jgi:lipopolysaccharide/colanic/teichoic acid biosynthesis glycosyltransferase
MITVTAEPMAFTTTRIGVADAPRSSTWSLAGAQARVAAYAIAKRTLDVVAAVMLLLALLPVFALVGLAICVDSGWPVFYVPERVGRYGRSFRCLKFRSMRSGADTAAHKAFVQTLMRDGANCSLYKVPGDCRITRVGAFLRRTSLDELPQLWNVLRGEMSLVGPRPDVTYALTDYSEWMHDRLQVKPGLTGLWQVSGRSRLSLLDMYRLDVAYVAGASLRLDLSILLRTVPVVLGRDGAA